MYNINVYIWLVCFRDQMTIDKKCRIILHALLWRVEQSLFERFYFLFISCILFCGSTLLQYCFINSIIIIVHACCVHLVDDAVRSAGWWDRVHILFARLLHACLTVFFVCWVGNHVRAHQTQVFGKVLSTCRCVITVRVVLFACMCKQATPSATTYVLTHADTHRYALTHTHILHSLYTLMQDTIINTGTVTLIRCTRYTANTYWQTHWMQTVAQQLTRINLCAVAYYTRSTRIDRRSYTNTAGDTIISGTLKEHTRDFLLSCMSPCNLHTVF